MKHLVFGGPSGSHAKTVARRMRREVVLQKIGEYMANVSWCCRCAQEQASVQPTVGARVWCHTNNLMASFGKLITEWAASVCSGQLTWHR